MGKPLFYEISEKPVSTCIIMLCTAIWLYIQKKSVGYADVGMSYDSVVTECQHWRVITSAFSHISILHLLFNMNALWSLGVVEQLKHIGLGVEFYVNYTLILIILSAFLVLAVYHLLIHQFKFEYYKRVTAVGYSCVVFGWMTILSVKQPSSKLNLFGVLSLPISFAPFESLVFTSIIVPQASFLGHLAGIIVGYSIAWGLIQGVTNYWTVVFLGWILVACLYSLKQTSSFPMQFLEIEPVADPALPQLGLLTTESGPAQTDITMRPIRGGDLV